MKDIRTILNIGFDLDEWDVVARAMREINCEDLRIFAKEAILQKATLITEELK